jgi:hypothetical protein
MRTNIQAGDVVLMNYEHFLPMRWKLGISVAVHPGQDGLVRTVTLKCDGNEIKRPVMKVSLLPFKNRKIHISLIILVINNGSLRDMSTIECGIYVTELNDIWQS